MGAFGRLERNASSVPSDRADLFDRLLLEILYKGRKPAAEAQIILRNNCISVIFFFGDWTTGPARTLRHLGNLGWMALGL